MTTKPITEKNNLHPDIINWACDYLSSHGYSLHSHLPEKVITTPWSSVVRFDTSQGYIYLKHTPAQLALEAPITQLLHDQFHASVPEVIAHNFELHCFLMKDAGKVLRGILKKQFDATMLFVAVDQFTSLQMAVADHVTLFFDIGVPDWRLDKLPDLYKQLLLQKDILIAEGLSEADITQLNHSTPHIINLCMQLSAYAIKPSLVQCDFHDNNLLLDEASQTITIIDLGEIVISHPFFSLVGFLRQMKLHYALTDENAVYQQLQQACLNNFTRLTAKNDLSNAMIVAHSLWLVYEALAQYRLRLACDQAAFLSFQRNGKLALRLKELMINLQQMNKVNNS